jgi:glycosyltransferase involved in cell wall biosynthesis
VKVRPGAEKLVSVIIPTFNRASLVLEAVGSALDQTWPNVEIVVVDDGSTDNTRSVLLPYCERVKYFYQENAGRPRSRTLIRGIPGIP